jgi:hypothetical protein
MKVERALGPDIKGPARVIIDPQQSMKPPNDNDTEIY